MSVKFTKSPYLEATGKTPELFFSEATEKPKFSYGKVSFKDFSARYSSTGWMTRKALVLTGFSLLPPLAKAIYHFAKTIFIGIPATFICRGKVLKGHLFSAVRDFQEFFGVIMSLFNDRYGTYQIQESLFQKACYSCFPSSAKLRFAGEKLKDISLFAYKNIYDRNNLNRQFNLTGSIPNAEAKLNCSLDRYLNKTSDELLQQLTLEDLVNSSHHFFLKYGHIGKKEFQTLPTYEIQAALESELLNDSTLLNWLSEEHLQGIRLSKISVPTIANIFPCNKGEKENKPRFARLDPTEIQKALALGKLSKLRPLFSDWQLQRIDISKLSPQIIKNFFSDKFDKKENMRSFSLLNLDSIQKALELEKLEGVYLLSLLSEEQLKSLKLSKLTAETIKKLLLKGSLEEQEIHERFALFSSEEVQKALEKNKIGFEEAQLVSIGQFTKFDYTNISTNAVNNLFPSFSLKALTERFIPSYQHYSSMFSFYKPDIKNDPFIKSKLSPIAKILKGRAEFIFKSLSFKQLNQLKSNIYIFDSESKNFFDSILTESQAQLFNFYNALGLKSNATNADVKKAYRRLALRHHPDKMIKQPGEKDEHYEKRVQENKGKFQKINEAYSELVEANS